MDRRESVDIGKRRLVIGRRSMGMAAVFAASVLLFSSGVYAGRQELFPEEGSGEEAWEEETEEEFTEDAAEEAVEDPGTVHETGGESSARLIVVYDLFAQTEERIEVLPNGDDAHGDVFGEGESGTAEEWIIVPENAIPLASWEVPYYNQGNYGHVPFHGGTLQNSGCGILSFAMVASALSGRSVYPEEVASFASANGADPVSSWSAFGILAEAYGVPLKREADGPLWGGSGETIREELERGNLVLGSVSGGMFDPLGGGHYLVYTGVDPGGYVRVQDPGSRARTENSPYLLQEALGNCKHYWVFGNY